MKVYEKECVNNIKSKANEFANFKKLLLSVENFYKKWSEQLSNDNRPETSQIQLSSNESISDAMRVGKQYLKTLQLEEVKQKRIKFNEKMLMFKQNDFEPSCDKLLGQIVYTTKIKPVNNQFVDVINLKSLERFDHICIEKLDNQSIVLICTHNRGTRLVLMKGCEPWSVMRQTELTRTRFDAIHTARNRNSLFACLVMNFQNTLHSFDDNLEPIASITLTDSSPINSLASNSTQLIAWSSIGSKIYSFTHELRLTRTISLNVLRPDQPFYIPRFVNRMYVDEHNFYLVDYDFNMIVMTLDGVVQRRFKIEYGSECRLMLNNETTNEESELVVFDRVNTRLVYYDTKSGARVRERKLGGDGRTLACSVRGDLSCQDLNLVNSSSSSSGELFLLSSLENAVYVFLA